MKRFKSSQFAAFTLIEVVIGISILSVVLMAMGSLTVTAIRSNQANVNRLTAYYLAQEALEALRNMRDTNWLQNYDYNTGGDPFWGASFESDGYYTLSYRIERDPDVPVPWAFVSYGDGETARSTAEQDALLYWVTDSSGVYYLNDFTIPLSAISEETPFHRYIRINYDETAPDRFEATAVVFWDERNRSQKIEVTTEFTDWREGPI